MILSMQSPVKTLGGCGERKSALLAKLGIYTISDLLYHFPRGYVNKGDTKALREGIIGENESFILTLGSNPVSVRIPGGRTLTKCKAFDDLSSCTLIFFNQTYIKDVLQAGRTYRVFGKLSQNRGQYEITPTSVEPVIENVPLQNFFPVYPLTEGLTHKYISSLIRQTLDNMPDKEYEDVFSQVLRSRLDVCGIKEAFEYIHLPTDGEDINKGRSRFIAEELFIFSCSVTQAKSLKTQGDAPEMTKDNSKLNEFLSNLDFKLTDAQARTITEIRRDMLSPHPMARLVSGDVGSGKTVCAAAAAYIAVKNGYQCAFMAPTEILALQHFNDLSPMFERFGMRCAFLSASVKSAKRKTLLSELSEGKIDFLIGTHSLISDGVKFNNLGLVITDEQHRFGVIQKSNLAKKGLTPHVLVMSATPIPRTLALILFGDLDISVIDQMPPGRQKVETLITQERHRKRIYNFIREQINEGRQIYMVCPTIEPKEEDGEFEFLDFGYHSQDDTKIGKNANLKNVYSYSDELKMSVFPEFRVEFLHGKMNSKEKEKTMKAFVDGKINILVSTTVIEVGVNVPNASVMVVENAERFGLSQLHQLRGRVGRGKYKSYCILISDSAGENAKKRLEIMKTTSDGYKIAEYDLEMRGPGDFIPTNSSARQHGALQFKLAGLCTDSVLLGKIFDLAKEVFENDPLLESSENHQLKISLQKLLLEHGSVSN